MARPGTIKGALVGGVIGIVGVLLIDLVQDGRLTTGDGLTVDGGAYLIATAVTSFAGVLVAWLNSAHRQQQDVIDKVNKIDAGVNNSHPKNFRDDVDDFRTEVLGRLDVVAGSIEELVRTTTNLADADLVTREMVGTTNRTLTAIDRRLARTEATISKRGDS